MGSRYAGPPVLGKAAVVAGVFEETAVELAGVELAGAEVLVGISLTYTASDGCLPASMSATPCSDAQMSLPVPGSPKAPAVPGGQVSPACGVVSM